MQRNEIISELKKYFCIQELVCRHTYEKFKDSSWQFLDTELLHTLLVVRQKIGVGMTINNWHKGGTYTQRGLRCNLCQLVKDKTVKNNIYLSAHCNGAGVDITFSGISAIEARQKIKSIEDDLPVPIRLELDVNWVHLDVYDLCNGNKINYFKG